MRKFQVPTIPPDLTKRQLICFTLGALAGVPLYFLAKEPLGNSTAALLMILTMMPFLLLAMYEKHGQPLEKVVRNMLRVAVLRPKQRPYKTNNFYALLERQANLDEEVYKIVHGKQEKTNRETGRNPHPANKATTPPVPRP